MWRILYSCDLETYSIKQFFKHESINMIAHMMQSLQSKTEIIFTHSKEIYFLRSEEFCNQLAYSTRRIIRKLPFGKGFEIPFLWLIAQNLLILREGFCESSDTLFDTE